MRKVSLALFVLFVVVSAFVMPVPSARACYSYCGIDNCYATSEYGYYRARSFGGPTYTVLLEKPMCTGSRFEQLYYACEEFPCISKGETDIPNGKLYVMGSDNADIVELTVPESKVKEIEKYLDHSNLQRDIAIASTATRFSLKKRHLTPEEFRDRHTIQ